MLTLCNAKKGYTTRHWVSSACLLMTMHAYQKYIFVRHTSMPSIMTVITIMNHQVPLLMLICCQAQGANCRCPVSGADLIPGKDLENIIYMTLCMDEGTSHSLQAGLHLPATACLSCCTLLCLTLSPASLPACLNAPALHTSCPTGHQGCHTLNDVYTASWPACLNVILCNFAPHSFCSCIMLMTCISSRLRAI